MQKTHSVKDLLHSPVNKFIALSVIVYASVATLVVTKSISDSAPEVAYQSASASGIGVQGFDPALVNTPSKGFTNEVYAGRYLVLYGSFAEKGKNTVTIDNKAVALTYDSRNQLNLKLNDAYPNGDGVYATEIKVQAGSKQYQNILYIFPKTAINGDFRLTDINPVNAVFLPNMTAVTVSTNVSWSSSICLLKNRRVPSDRGVMMVGGGSTGSFATTVSNLKPGQSYAYQVFCTRPLGGNVNATSGQVITSNVDFQLGQPTLQITTPVSKVTERDIVSMNVYYNDGSGTVDVTNEAVWRSYNTKAAEVLAGNQISSSSKAIKGITPNFVTIAATYKGLTATTELQVVPQLQATIEGRYSDTGTVPSFGIKQTAKILPFRVYASKNTALTFKGMSFKISTFPYSASSSLAGHFLGTALRRLDGSVTANFQSLDQDFGTTVIYVTFSNNETIPAGQYRDYDFIVVPTASAIVGQNYMVRMGSVFLNSVLDVRGSDFVNRVFTISKR